MHSRSGNETARQVPARSLPQKLVHGSRQFLRRLGFRASPRRYWETRAVEHGVRSVLDLRHPESEVDAMTAMQAGVLFPLLQARLRPGDRRVLDFGCGPGRFTAGLARLVGGTVVGLDPVEHYLALAPRAPGVEYRRFNGRRIDEPDASFDVVWICLVLGGIVKSRELKRTVHEIERVLKPGGLLFLVENTAETPDGMYWKYRSPEQYCRLFPAVDLSAISAYTDIDQRISVMAGRKR